MPFIIAEPPKLQEVFTLSIPQHMLEKLYWEINIFKACINSTDARLTVFRDSGFASMNCAVTAAHCADWAWSAAGPETKAALSKRFGFVIKGKARTDETAFFDALENANRDFYICRRLANGAKHMRRGKQPHSIHAVLNHRIATIAGKERLVFDFAIKDGDVDFLAVDVFDRMFSFWEALYRELGFIEDRFVDGS